MAHDCVLGNNIVLSNVVKLAGHVELGDWVIMGGYAGAHQFCQGGRACLHRQQHGSVIRDIPPYVLATGHPAEPRSVNIEGLKRRGFTEEQIRAIRNAYRVLYRSDLKLEDARGADCAQWPPSTTARASSSTSSRSRRAAWRAERRVDSRLNGPLRIGLVAGEASGDLLGAALIEALRARVPEPTLRRPGRRAHARGGLRAAGIVRGTRGDGAGGAAAPPAAAAAPARAAASASSSQRRIDVFVGVDSPAFNLGLARRLHSRAA